MAIRNIAIGQSGDIYRYSFIDIEGNSVPLASFKGKKLMFVNVASKCAYTPQYDNLQELHSKYGDRIVIIGFPCNNFLSKKRVRMKKFEHFVKEIMALSF